MTIQQLRDAIIEDGIKSVKNDDKLRPECKEGSIEGFEMLRDIDVSTPKATIDLIRKMTEENFKERDMVHQGIITSADYWKMRYRLIQLEFANEVLKWGWSSMGIEVGPKNGNAMGAYDRIMKKKSQIINN